MSPLFVLLHSPLLGPSSWRPVADALEREGHRATVPSLSGIAETGPPFWPHLVTAVVTHLERTASQKEPVVLVPHSNAGFFVPRLTAEPAIEVAGCVFVDAALPARTTKTPVVPPGAMAFLREKATDGVLPPWTEWWDEEDLRGLFPDTRTRRTIVAEQPRLPLAYFEQTVPVPAHWDDLPCVYVQFNAAYDEDARRARDQGWRVERIPEEHLHMLVDPTRVARSLVEAAERTGMGA